MTWQEAKTACNNISGRLVEIETEEEQALLVAEKKKRSNLPPNMWIGLNDLDEEGVWRWNESARTTFTAWAVGQPNSVRGEQDCAVMYFKSNGKWNDFWCNGMDGWKKESVGAICEL